MTLEKNIKILIVEDDESFREMLKTVLEVKYEVFDVPNGLKAKEILLFEKFNLIISDIQMPFCTGIELLKWVKSDPHLKATPMILITGFSQILETKNAVDLGADDFLSKPFSTLDLLEKMERFVTPKTLLQKKNIANAAIDLDAHFCKVPIEDFITEKNTDYGIYLRISKEKYIKISHEGGKLSEDRIKDFKEKGMDFLYIREEEFARFVGFTVFINKTITSASTDKITNEKKLHFLTHTGEIVMEHIFISGINEKSFFRAKEFLESSLKMLTSDTNLFNVLQILNSHMDHLYVHAVAVSLFSYMIAKEMGFSSPQILFKIAMGGLFHDIGKKEIPRELLDKPRYQLTSEEVSIIESHVTRGKSMLEHLEKIPSEVIMIVHEHHENNLGNGYPLGLDKKHINPLTQIVMVADTFCELTIKENSQSIVEPPMEALRRIESQKLDYLSEEAFNALKSIFKKAKKDE